MARSLFDLNSLGLSRSKLGFQGRYEPEIDVDPRPLHRRMPEPALKRRKLPWIFPFIGYHLAAAFGIVVAFVIWLIWNSI